MIFDYLDILIAKLALWSIRRGYGYCDKAERVADCASCRASEVQDWLTDHVALIRHSL